MGAHWCDGVDDSIFVHHSALLQDGFRKPKDSGIINGRIRFRNGLETFATNVERVAA